MGFNVYYAFFPSPLQSPSYTVARLIQAIRDRKQATIEPIGISSTHTAIHACPLCDALACLPPHLLSFVLLGNLSPASFPTTLAIRCALTGEVVITHQCFLLISIVPSPLDIQLDVLLSLDDFLRIHLGSLCIRG